MPCVCRGAMHALASRRTLIQTLTAHRLCVRRWGSLEKLSGPHVCPQGVRNYSTPVGLDARVLVDLVVVGSVAVSEKGKITNRNSRV